MVRFKAWKVSSGSHEDWSENEIGGVVEAGTRASQSCWWPRPEWGQQNGKRWARSRDCEMEWTVEGRERERENSHGASSGLSVLASSDRGLFTPRPLPDWHPGRKTWGADLFTGPQGAVWQSLREFGALASKYLQPGAGAFSPVSSPSFCSVLFPVSCLPGAKLLITVIPHVPHLNFTKAVIHPLSHTVLPKRQGQSRIRLSSSPPATTIL